MIPGEDGRPRGHGAGRLPTSVVEDLLDSARRRHLVAVLDEADGPLSVAEVARKVRAREHNTTPDAVSDDAVHETCEDIYEEHLPKLTAVEVVTYDSLVGTVELSTDDRRLISRTGQPARTDESTDGMLDGS